MAIINNVINANATSPLPVTDGGTGANTLTIHGLLKGDAAGAVSALPAATNGQLPIGSTGADPVLNTLTAGVGISITNGAGTITLGSLVSQGIVTLDGDTGAATGTTVTLAGGNNISTAASGSTVTFNVSGTTNHSLQVGNSTGSLTSLGVATNGQLAIGSTGASPVLAALTAGTGISISNGAGSITIGSLVSQGIVTLDGDSGSATGTTVTLAGGNSITTSASGSTVTIGVSGTTTHALQIGDAGHGLTSLGVATNGQFPIGSTGADPVLATLTAGANITITNGAGSITIAATGGGGGITTLEADDTNTASGSTVTIAGDATNIFTTANNASTLTISQGPNLVLPATNSALNQGTIQVGGEVFMQFYGDAGSGYYNIGIGKNSTGPGTINPGGGGVSNLGIGDETLTPITTGAGNAAVGYLAGANMTTGSLNQLFGYGAGASISTGSHNTCVGQQSATLMGGGSYNCVMGAFQAGVSWTGNETSNLCIGSPGVLGENNTIRIGDQGTGNAQQNACYIAGINGVTVGSPTFVTIDTGTNQLGVSAGGSGITTIDGDTGSATGATVTFNATATAGASVNFTASGSTVSLDIGDTVLTNTIVGVTSGNGSITGVNNTSLGQGNFASLTSGSDNTAMGVNALFAVTDSPNNTALGDGALAALVTGSGYNTAVGISALTSLGSGDNNIGIGLNAGGSYTTTETSNIIIGNAGVIADANTIRIGTQGAGSGQQNTCYVAGITGVTVANSAAVLIDTTTGQLGTVISSARFKTNITDMGDRSSGVMNLRPVNFSYKEDVTKSMQFGLIAEEVAEVMPQIVTYDAAGNPHTVRYHELPSILLNEMKKLLKRVEVLEGRCACSLKE